MASAEKLWDVIIVGAGPAGISAALVLARSRRSVLIIDAGNQRNLKSHGLHNLITRDGILPPEFLHLAHQDLKKISCHLQTRKNYRHRCPEAQNRIYRAGR